MLVTVSTIIMIVVYFAKVSVLHPRVVISSSFDDQRNLYNAMPTRAQSHCLDLRLGDHYMPLQSSTSGRDQLLLRFPTKASLAMLGFPTTGPSCTMLLHRVTTNVPSPSSEQDYFLGYHLLVSKLFHTGHMVAQIVLGCRLLRIDP
jgi:hypothetical protein